MCSSRSTISSPGERDAYYLTIWAVENAMHIQDLFPPAPRPSLALKLARALDQLRDGDVSAFASVLELAGIKVQIGG